MRDMSPEQLAAVSGAMEFAPDFGYSCNVYQYDAGSDINYQMFSCARDAAEYVGYQSTPTDIPFDALAGP